jgi:hypothetical protein
MTSYAFPADDERIEDILPVFDNDLFSAPPWANSTIAASQSIAALKRYKVSAPPGGIAWPSFHPLLVDLDVRLLRDLEVLVDFRLLKGREF